MKITKFLILVILLTLPFMLYAKKPEKQQIRYNIEEIKRQESLFGKNKHELDWYKRMGGMVSLDSGASRKKNYDISIINQILEVGNLKDYKLRRILPELFYN